MGYSTLYGDMAGGFAPIKDVPKTLVYELARWRNAKAIAAATPPIPERTIDEAAVAPSCGPTSRTPTRCRRTTCSTRSIEAYVEDDLASTTSSRAGSTARLVERIVRMIDRAEYKRRQAAPGVKITPKAFGRDRRMPITNRYPG